MNVASQPPRCVATTDHAAGAGAGFLLGPGLLARRPEGLRDVQGPSGRLQDDVRDVQRLLRDHRPQLLGRVGRREHSVVSSEERDGVQPGQEDGPSDLRVHAWAISSRTFCIDRMS